MLIHSIVLFFIFSLGSPAHYEQYLILRNPNASEAATSQFSKQLAAELGPLNVKALEDEIFGIIYWSVALNSSQYSQLRKSSVILEIMQDSASEMDDTVLSNSTLAYRDDSTYLNVLPSNGKLDGTISQSNAPTELRVVSQPLNVDIIDLVEDYKYDPTAGSEVTVYIVDSGANPSHPEYSTMPGAKRWIFPGNDPPSNLYRVDTSQTDPIGHGSCVLSKVAGPLYGVAKKANVVIIKNPAIPNPNKVYESAFMQMLLAIRKDIQQNNLQGKAVVNISFQMSINNENMIHWMQKIIQSIIDLDVPIVTSSGNAGTRTNISTYPAYFASQVDGLIVVGATDNNGHAALFSQTGSLISVYAPGVMIKCASNLGDGIKRNSGSSYAASAVAGLAAYFLSLEEFRHQLQQSGQVAKNVKGLIQNFAYSRNGGPPVLWNGQNGDSCVNFQHRDGAKPACVTSPLRTSLSAIPGPTAATSNAKSFQTWHLHTVSAKSSFINTTISPTKPSEPGPTAATSNAKSFQTWHLHTVSAKSSFINTTISPSKSSKPKPASNQSMTTTKISVPPITSCYMTKLASTTVSGKSFGATSYCKCNGGRLADIGSTVGADKFTTYTCKVNRTTLFPVSTIAPTNIPGKGGLPGCAAVLSTAGTSAYCNCGGTPAPTLHPTVSGLMNCDYTIQPTSPYNPVVPTTAPYKSGSCHARVWQGIGQITPGPDVYIAVNITDADGVLIGQNSSFLNWAQTLGTDSKLPWVLLVTPQTAVEGDKRVGVGAVDFAYGSQTWNTTSSQCSVGKWDNGSVKGKLGDYTPSRRLDCKFDCPGK